MAITTGFHGTQLLLFGAISGETGDDIVVIVTGPDGPVPQDAKTKCRRHLGQYPICDLEKMPRLIIKFLATVLWIKSFRQASKTGLKSAIAICHC